MYSSNTTIDVMLINSQLCNLSRVFHLDMLRVNLLVGWNGTITVAVSESRARLSSCRIGMIVAY